MGERQTIAGAKSLYFSSPHEQPAIVVGDECTEQSHQVSNGETKGSNAMAMPSVPNTNAGSGTIPGEARHPGLDSAVIGGSCGAIAMDGG